MKVEKPRTQGIKDSTTKMSSTQKTQSFNGKKQFSNNLKKDCSLI
jgi:hypothetical protein